MRARSLVTGLVFMAWLAGPAVLGVEAAGQSGNTSQGPDVVVTAGEGLVRRMPDRAVLTVTVETKAKSPREAQQQNAQLMAAVQKRLTEARVAADAMKTIGYEVEPLYDYSNNQRVARGFLARNSLEVTLDEVERAGEVIDLAVQGGASAVSGVRFELKDRAAAERDALRLAVADARARADAAAAGAGRVVERVMRIEDTSAARAVEPRPVFAMARAAAPAAETPVAPGALEIRAQVTLTSLLR